MNLNLFQFFKFCPYIKLLASFQGLARELEVHTVYQRFLTSWQRPILKDISDYFACFIHVPGV